MRHKFLERVLIFEHPRAMQCKHCRTNSISKHSSNYQLQCSILVPLPRKIIFAETPMWKKSHVKEGNNKHPGNTACKLPRAWRNSNQCTGNIRSNQDPHVETPCASKSSKGLLPVWTTFSIESTAARPQNNLHLHGTYDTDQTRKTGGARSYATAPNCFQWNTLVTQLPHNVFPCGPWQEAFFQSWLVLRP